ncbi:protein kinase [Marinobacterium nitratireducens]|uniref:Protein kinase n=1 Tax=Marinobacterium nitratireducens TaxID=518897 RepID=A0A918DPL1_9GAMM|nr:bifunctional protein-serine/threonine kinase/phosphatase [Marinobacterium nitratireducens]GGO78467.1 protein kinase [Marinobacterium nitratireducens]
MTSRLKLRIGQHSDRGRKPQNQDCHGALIPREPQLSLKGAALAMADGISSSSVSQVASATAVQSFLDDYYCTSEAWSVRNAVERVLTATNSWLHAQTRNSEYRYDRDRGYVCTLSALVVKGATAHLFHVGDTRIYRVRGQALEQLTKDHRLWLSAEESYLSRALGIDEQLELDYQALPVHPGDTFLIATDGVYEHADTRFMLDCLRDQAHDLDAAAQLIVGHALERGSSDNLSLQILCVDEVPGPEHRGLQLQVEELPLPPQPQAGLPLDGYRIVREIHASSRSHVHLAEDLESGARVALKTPSIDLGEDPAYLERFMLEEWIARRINSVHVLKAAPATRPRSCLYTVSEYIEGRTLAQWLRDNPEPGLEKVRDFVGQIALGLNAFHRMEMLHQDLRPENLMIDQQGTLKIIDFGSTRVAGILESGQGHEQPHLLGTALYSAPEYFLGEPGSTRSDLYSLAVIAYHMLSGRFPYGTDVPKARTAAAQRRLQYRPLLDDEREIPSWIDETLKKALHPDPQKRYGELSEFVYDLRHPSQAFIDRTRPPLMERDPVRFWQGVSLSLVLVIVFMLLP